MKKENNINIFLLRSIKEEKKLLEICIKKINPNEVVSKMMD
jgi:hypothetical protein